MKLPLNCKVDYIPDFLSQRESEELYHTLINEYKIDQARLILEILGEEVKTDIFKILFVTESLLQSESHPENIHGKSFLWSGIMANLRERVEDMLGQKFELAMCLYYPDGNFFTPYHTDQQTSGHKTILPSISLGEVREFCFKENETQEVFTLDLANGSLLVMSDYCQSRYEHSLPQNTKYKKGRINITFREADFK